MARRWKLLFHASPENAKLPGKLDAERAQPAVSIRILTEWRPQGKRILAQSYVFLGEQTD